MCTWNVCMRTSVSNESTDFWARLCWLSLCPGFLLWQLAERVGASPAWWHRVDVVLINESSATTPPLSEPFQPTALNCACVFTVFGVGKKCIPSVMCRNSNPHPSRARPLHHPSVLYPSSHFCHPSNPPLMGLLINSWSCDGCVHRYDVSEC